MKRPGCALLLLLAAVGLLGAGAYLAQRQIEEAGARFGAPSGNSGWLQRWQLSRQLLAAENDLTQPVAVAPGTTLTIPAGENAADIARRLQNQGLIPNAAAFLAYVRYKGWDTALQAGTFHLEAPLTPVALAALLRRTPPREAVLAVLPGWRREEIAAALPSSGLALRPEAFLEATAHANGYTLPVTAPAGASLEGFLAPGRYTLPRDASVKSILAQMLTRASQWLSPQWQQAVRTQGLTPYQGLILASIVQRETFVSAEMPHIAAVYLNRLHKGMPLEADPTVQYALGKPGHWWPAPLTADNLKANSPYNTYLHNGLPPAPIANPAREALQAVAHPLKSDDLFFRAACDGSGRHIFARTYQAHLRNACP